MNHDHKYLYDRLIKVYIIYCYSYIQSTTRKIEE